MSDDVATQLAKMLSQFGRIRGGEDFHILTGYPQAEHDVLLPEMVFVAKAHKGQTRRDNGRPYLDHVMQVWTLTRMSGGNINQQLAALCHDVPEDCEANLGKTTAELVADTATRLNEDVRNIVAQLTDPRPNMPLDEKVERAAALQGEARLVKLADCMCNFYDVMMNPPKQWDVDDIRDYVEYRCRMIRALEPSPPLVQQLLSYILIGLQEQWGPDILPEAA